MSEADTSLEQRVATALNGATPPPENAEESAKAEPAKEEAKAAPAVDHEAERQSKLARVHALEQQQYAKAQKITERERELEARAKQLQDVERSVKQLESAFNDPDALLEMLEKRVGGEKLSQWILAQADPGKKAEAAARKATSAVEDKLKALQEENKQWREKLENERKQAQEKAAFDAAAREISSRVAEVAEEAPLAARFFEKRPQAAIRMADSIARSFEGRQFNYDDVIIKMQEALAADSEIFSAQHSGTDAKSTPASSKPAAAKAKNTLSNRDAADRTAIVEPEDISKLSLDERQKHFERRLRAIR